MIAPHATTPSTCNALARGGNDARVSTDPHWSQMSVTIRGGREPRSVLHRFWGKPLVAPSQSPVPPHQRRRGSAAAASVIAMVHSPRTFGTRTTTEAARASHAMPDDWWGDGIASTTSSDRASTCSSECSSPVPTLRPTPVLAPRRLSFTDENEAAIVLLRQQVALLVKRLEDEKKRRALEQQLMQTKILELQSYIRANGLGSGDVRATDGMDIQGTGQDAARAPRSVLMVNEDEG
ncbi:hypothetical protein PsorP6_016148 [Peronosclerospora sorghi]|uniref:Uncharacterized protein n=1 Tax=Peronosclerospora sorghi TaxID=230839 RepID=A0ACC0VII9_9STRA|nr:hypothetical protein PsorP6_016148 [Peronosclerospora sorghi]